MHSVKGVEAADTGGTVSPHPVADGLVHHQAGRHAQAQSLYLRALEAQPDDAEALYFLGVLRHQQGNGLEAVALITKALAIDPNHAEACYSLGLALRGARRRSG
ncbi:tetratricopeptide repeat protein [Bradyrhizobium sp. USDA 3240]